LDLDGNLTVVTDGPGGLGLEIARDLGRNGTTVIITSRNIASEYGQYNIRLYSVALGDVYTVTMRRSPSRNELVEAKKENKMKILGQPEEATKSICFLVRRKYFFLNWKYYYS
jgi:NAD(P)-dependent dehydrogenase (short-subunit alcohol dehydrogenase family)